MPIDFSDGHKVGQKDIIYRKLLKDLCFFHCRADSILLLFLW